MNNKQSKITNQDLKDRITKLKEEKKELKARIAAFKKSNTVCKLTEESLKESKEKLRLIIDNSRIGICVTDLKGNFIDVNNALTKMLGYSKKEIRAFITKNELDVDPKEFKKLEDLQEAVIDEMGLNWDDDNNDNDD